MDLARTGVEAVEWAIAGFRFRIVLVRVVCLCHATGWLLLPLTEVLTLRQVVSRRLLRAASKFQMG